MINGIFRVHPNNLIRSCNVAKENYMMTPATKEQVRSIRFPELQEILGGVSRTKIGRDVANGEPPVACVHRLPWMYSMLF